MKITIKTLQQKVFQIDADAEDTVEILKKKINEAQGHPVETQKLIYAGRVLLDSKTVASCEIKEKDFLVLMVAKPKPTFAPPPASSSSSSSSPAPAVAVAAQPATPATSEATPSAPPPPAATSPIPTPAAQTAQPVTGDFIAGPALESTIQNMVEMGFPREEVARALRASFNNPERAVEYLFNGIPAHLNPPPVAQTRSAPLAAPAPALAPAPAPAQPPVPGQPQNLFQLAHQQQQQQGGGGLGAGAGLGSPGLPDLAALRDNNQLRDAVAQNPALLQPLIQQLAASNPQLAQILAQNPEQLINLLGGGGEDGDDEGGDIPAQIINVTPEDQAAIERLEALGFPRHAVIEAYFACDKNEELAANYLFESGGE